MRSDCGSVKTELLFLLFISYQPQAENEPTDTSFPQDRIIEFDSLQK